MRKYKYRIEKEEFEARRTADFELTSGDVLTELAKHWSGSVCCHVAANPNTPRSVLDELAEDKDMHVRAWVALNPNAPIELLSRYASSEDGLFREYSADNPSTPATALAELACDENLNIRTAVAKTRTHRLLYWNISPRTRRSSCATLLTTRYW